MSRSLPGVKPGWYLLALTIIYAGVITVVAARQDSELRKLRTEMEAPRSGSSAASVTTQPDGLWLPLPGAELPDNPAHLPNSLRAYRQGVSQGFDFYDGDSGVPVPYGMAAVAAGSGTVVRADHSFREAEPEEWRSLMSAVADGATDEELDRLRGRQVWLETDGGRLLRYAHLSAVREDLEVGNRLERGRVVGFVGNSGTDEGVAGTRRGARLHFEIWEGEEFFGQGMSPDEVRIAAVSLFTGP